MGKPESRMTPEFRVSYPFVFEARKNEKSGKMEYSLTALFPLGCDIKALQELAKKAAEEKWGTDQKKWPKNFKSPFRDQGEMAKDVDQPDGTTKSVLRDGYVKGAKFITIKSRSQPGIVDGKLQPIISPEHFYAGCYARATVVAFPYSNSGNNGVSFWMNNIQKTRDGAPISGRRQAEEEFEAIDVGDGATAADASGEDIFGS